VSIGTFSNIALLPVSGGASLIDPVAIWSGEANVTGDASGDPLEHSFQIPDGDQRKFVLVIDSISGITSTAVDPGNWRVEVQHRHELANIALDNSRFISGLTRSTSGNQVIESTSNLTAWLRSYPIWWRRLFANVDAERAFLTVGFTTNNNTQVYQIRAMGRAFDARILASPVFWELFRSG